MLKYVDAKVVFAEIPDEITLAISISGCPCNCRGCHSSYLSGDIGNHLTDGKLGRLIDDNPGITCIAFMGGDSNPGYIDRLSRIVRNKGLKCAWYSGRPSVSDKINKMHFHYIKTGPYIRQYGPLNNPQTNQRFYKVGNDGELTDITFRFYKQSRYYENNTGNNSILIN